MQFEEKLNRYANLVIKVGVNLQKGEKLVINSPITCAEMARALAKFAYKAGAKDVRIDYSDELMLKLRYQNTDTETLCDIPQWKIEARTSIVDEKACYIAIASEDPELFSDIEPQKMADYSKTCHTKMKKFFDASMANEIKWCIISAPSVSWAKKIFPDKSDDDAVNALWELIFKAMRVYEDDPVEAWNTHNQNLIKYCKFLNKNQFVSFHYKNSLGTDLTVGMPNGYKFIGGLENSTDGCPFVANMPTEEVFSAPDKYNVNGKLVASMPLCHMGKLIDNFSFIFKNGRVESFTAEKGYDTLKGIMDTDEGANYLGEISFISYDTPIQRLKTIFLNTLFDENASCHFALGKAYPSCVEGSDGKTAEELDAMGINTSLEHVDFMVGTSDLEIIGKRADGSTVQIFKNGNFVI